MRLGCKHNPIGQGTEMDDTDLETKPSQSQGGCYPSTGQECRPAVAIGKKNQDPQALHVCSFNFSFLEKSRDYN